MCFLELREPWCLKTAEARSAAVADRYQVLPRGGDGAKRSLPAGKATRGSDPGSAPNSFRSGVDGSREAPSEIPM